MYVITGLVLFTTAGFYAVLIPFSRQGCPVEGNTGILEERLSDHVWMMADKIGERHHEKPETLVNTVAYLLSEFEQMGYIPVLQQFGNAEFTNLIASKSGLSDSGDTIITGAHYDTVWMSAGADDNASGVAVLLEIARLLVDIPLMRSIRFIAFANEEQPFAESDLMGSKAYLASGIASDERITAMYSLEMLGYYSDEINSQHYPAPLNWFYPDKADFIAFVGNIPSGSLLFRSLYEFRSRSEFPVQGLVMSESLIPDIRRSDHASFWDRHYPAIMVTDTAFYRNNRYHTVGDLPHTLDYQKMAVLTHGLACMLAGLSGVHTD